MAGENGWLLLAILASSLVPGVVIFALPEGQRTWRTVLNLAGAFLKVGLVVAMAVGLQRGMVFHLRLPLTDTLELLLAADPLAALFATLSSVLWLFTTLYAVGYLEDSPNRSHFFGYFSLCVTVTIGISLAGNLLTFLLFYEMLTLATYPLIIHRGTPEALAAGRDYLAYAFGGGALLLFAVIWFTTLTGATGFDAGGLEPSLVAARPVELRLVFVLLLAGMGVKAALVPLHGWLPRAMVAPAPVSALLHAVAVVKAGAFGIVRLVLDTYGVAAMAKLGLFNLVTSLAALTVLYGSLLALRQDDLKKRLAYSTVSQVSYIALGVSLAPSAAAVTGGLVHLVHQGVMKITLFFCAGNLAETLGIHRISEMAGVGRRMPLTMAAFSMGALGMIGLPPTAGFVSKWFLVQGGLEAGNWWVVAVLAASSLLNACYFFPILGTAWFGVRREEPWPPSRHPWRLEGHWMLLLPTVVLGIAILLVGVLANSGVSPLAWVRFLVRGYGL